MSFQKKLDAIIAKNNSLLCVGLDPDSEKNPDEPLFSFNKHIIDQTYDLVCAYKPNSAFYEAHGADGIVELKRHATIFAKPIQTSPLFSMQSGEILALPIQGMSNLYMIIWVRMLLRCIRI